MGNRLGLQGRIISMYMYPISNTSGWLTGELVQYCLMEAPILPDGESVQYIRLTD